MTIMPEMVVHFDISRERSIAAVQEAMVEDQKILDDLRDYSKGMINLTPEDLHLNEQQRVYVPRRPQQNNNQRRPQQNNNQRKKY